MGGWDHFANFNARGIDRVSGRGDKVGAGGRVSWGSGAGLKASQDGNDALTWRRLSEEERFSLDSGISGIVSKYGIDPFQKR